MAAADTQVSNSNNNSHHHEYYQQDPEHPSVATRFPAHSLHTAGDDTKTGGYRQPRRGLTQVFTNAYHDILHSWMGLHRAFYEPAAPARHRPQPPEPPRYETFPYGGADGDDCCYAAATNATAFAAAIGDMILEPYINGLLICVPIGVSAYWAAAPSIVVFAVNALAIVPLSSLLTDATERIALEAGDAVGAFLNISLGNIVELILFVTLVNGHVRIVQASILGSILVNLLPILGSALIGADTTGGDDSLDSTETQMLACLLFVSVFVFMIPTAFRFTFVDARNVNDIVVSMSRASAILILIMYVAYFLHTMSRRPLPDEQDGEQQQQPPPVTPPPLLLRLASPPLTPGPRTLRFDANAKTKPTSDLYARRGVFEIGPPASVDSDWTEEEPPRGRSLTGIYGPPHGAHSAHTASSPLLLPPHMRRYRSRSLSAGSSRSRASSGTSGRPGRSFVRAGLARVLSNDRQELMEAAGGAGRLGAILASAAILVVASILLAVSARLLAGTLDAVTRRQGLSEAVIGLVILPLAGNLSSYLTVVAVATRDNLDLAVAVSAGSAIQVALCVAPLTVLAGWVLGKPVMLALDVFEMAMLLGAVSLVNLLVLGGGSRNGDGRRATGLKGGILCACFLVIGIATFFAPNVK
ncbi:hypothetical protein V2A60_006522 [Cordyceps javanica]|uniref:Sodium/calcium transporter n=1 Tax=Cordyceps javanica TaxID=43265 RepID=A0A545W543_9HYPO|nr:sodium/calcium transporter [Cordyceps javanica]TQW09072.1 sodium/calcium transporter [Cordyceps javanica]